MKDIITSDEPVVKGTEELEKQIAEEILIPDNNRSVAELFKTGKDANRRRNPTNDNKNS